MYIDPIRTADSGRQLFCSMYGSLCLALFVWRSHFLVFCKHTFWCFARTCPPTLASCTLFKLAKFTLETLHFLNTFKHLMLQSDPLQSSNYIARAQFLTFCVETPCSKNRLLFTHVTLRMSRSKYFCSTFDPRNTF